MPLASLFKRSKAAPAPSASPAGPEDDGPVQQARVRARRRLIGAVVLMGLGVVLFPLLFETQPRPLPRDIPIEVARKGAEPAPAASPVQAESSLSEREALEPASASASATPVATAAAPARASEAPAIAPAPAPKAQAASAASADSPAAASRPAPAKAEPKPEAKPTAEAVAAKASAPTSSQASSPTAGPASAPGSGRFVVQVGAFTDPAALREARQRVEKLGMKSYTQEIVTPAGKRTRVRVGPFATREEADRAGARLKAAGLPAYMLQL